MALTLEFVKLFPYIVHKKLGAPPTHKEEQQKVIETAKLCSQANARIQWLHLPRTTTEKSMYLFYKVDLTHTHTKKVLLQFPPPPFPLKNATPRIL